MIALYIGLGILALVVVAGYFIFVRPWSAMADEEKRMRRDRESQGPTSGAP